MIRIDAMWLATESVDMGAGPDRLLALVVAVFGAARAHQGYVFANVRGTRLKLLVNDGFGVWCATRRLHQGRFSGRRLRPNATSRSRGSSSTLSSSACDGPGLRCSASHTPDAGQLPRAIRGCSDGERQCRRQN